MVLLKIYTWRDTFERALAHHAKAVCKIKVSGDWALLSVCVRLLCGKNEPCSSLTGSASAEQQSIIVEILGPAPVIERVRPVARMLAGSGWITLNKYEA
jgi:hypothetical protein